MKERIANWLRGKLDAWSPPWDVPVTGHVVIVGHEGERAVFKIAGPVSLHAEFRNRLLPIREALGQANGLSARDVGVVVRLGEKVDEAPDWLLERLDA